MAFAGGVDVSASAAVRSLPLTCQARLAMRVSRRQIAPLEASRRGVRRGQRRGGVGCKAELQSDNLRREIREATLEAIESSDSGRLTPGDAAAASGLPLTEAERALQAVASDTGAALQVSQSGDIVYAFKGNVRNELLTRSTRQQVEEVLVGGGKVALAVTRAGFGIFLVVSIILVWTTLIAITSQNSRDERRGSSGGGMFYVQGWSPFDFYWWNINYNNYNKPRDEMGFLESLFSFVFGDGNPNAELESLRWKLIGDKIARNGGVVTAEELAPFLDMKINARSYSPGDDMDESFVLPVLQRLQGTPQVDKEGNIAYVFPEFQKSASNKGKFFSNMFSKQENTYAASMLSEQEYGFSRAPGGKLFLAGLLGFANVAGVWTLSTLPPSILLQAARNGGVVGFTIGLLPILQIYAISFFGIPLIRALTNSLRNAAIRERNENRESFATLLQRRPENLRRKLEASRQLSARETIRSDDIYYSSEKDISDQAKVDSDAWEGKFQRRYRADK